MSENERERLLEQAYDAERAGNHAEAERLRKLAKEDAPDADAAAAERLRRHRITLYFPWQPS